VVSVITDEQRATLLWAAREVESAIKAGDTRRAKELIAAQHAIIEEAWQRAVQAGGNAALARITASGPVVPGRFLVRFGQAEPETKADFLTGLRELRGLDGNVGEWLCASCNRTISGDDLLISYRAPPPMPVCTTSSCRGYGPALVPAPSG
jgi:hypothetical protein